MKFSSASLAAAATLLFATTAFALNAPSRLESGAAVQKVADQRAQEKPTTTGVGAPGSKVGPSTGATPPATQMGSQDTSKSLFGWVPLAETAPYSGAGSPGRIT